MYQDPNFLDVVSHVSSCPYLHEGTYQCPYCNKEENFWDPYGGGSSFADKDGGASAQLASQYAQAQGSAHSHAFHQMPAELDTGNSAQVFMNTPQGPRSPNPSVTDKRRKLGQMSDAAGRFTTELHHAQIQGPSQAFNHAVRYAGVPELPNTGIARADSTHLSPRGSPDPRGSPHLGHDTYMHMVPFGQVAGMPFDGSAGMISPSHASPQQQQQQQQMMGPGMHHATSPKRRSRAFSGTIQAGAASSAPGSARVSPVGSSMAAAMGQEQKITIERRRSGASEVEIISSGGQLEPEKGSLTCKQCGKVLRGKVAWLPSNLQRHMREIHLSAPKTECRTCGRTFNRGHNLRHHMKAVHGEQP